MTKPTTKPDPRKVSELKAKAKSGSNTGSSNLEGNINDVLYGIRTENQRAQGVGEYDQ